MQHRCRLSGKVRNYPVNPEHIKLLPPLDLRLGGPSIELRLAPSGRNGIHMKLQVVMMRSVTAIRIQCSYSLFGFSIPAITHDTVTDSGRILRSMSP
jgi:hypothetical protein